MCVVFCYTQKATFKERERREKNRKYKTKQNKESLERGERKKLDAKLRDIQRLKR